MKDSRFGRLLGVLVAPGETFRSIAARPTWVVPLIVLVLLGVAVQWLMQSRLDPEEMIRKQTESMGVELSQEQIDEQVEQASGSGRRAIGLAFGTVGGALFYFFAAFIFWAGLRLFGSELGYMDSLATTVHGFLPFGVAALLGIPLILGRETIGFEEAMGGGVLVSNLAFLAPEDAGAVTRGLLQSVDFFSLWVIVLLVIGYRATAKVSTGVATGVVLVVWIFGVALKVGMLALPGLIAGGGS